MAWWGDVANRPALFMAGYIISVGSLVIFAFVGVGLWVDRVKSKDKQTPHDAEKGNATEQKAAAPTENTSGPQAVPWILFVLLAIGAICCAVSVGMDTARG